MAPVAPAPADAIASRTATVRLGPAAHLSGLALLLLLAGLALPRAEYGMPLDTLTVHEARHIIAGVQQARSGD
jgi:hypothetical protein